MSKLTKLIRSWKKYRFSEAASRARLKGNSTVDCLRREVMDIERLFNVIPDFKIIYIEVSKAGCTTTKSLLSQAVFGAKSLPSHGDWHDRKKSRLLPPSAVGFSTFDAMVSDPETLAFSVVRNPFSRLESCYRNKIADVPISDRDHLTLKSLVECPHFDQLSQRGWSSETLSFEDFVSLACATAATTVDTHWCLMSRIIPSPELLEVRTFKLENLAVELEPVLERLQATPQIRRLLDRPLNRSEGDVAWTEEMLAQVRQAYAEDFKRFGYSQELPVAA